MSRTSIKDRYTIENGIPTIRPLNPRTKQPMGTEAEIQAAWDDFVKAKANWKRPADQDPSYK